MSGFYFFIITFFTHILYFDYVITKLTQDRSHHIAFLGTKGRCFKCPNHLVFTKPAQITTTARVGRYLIARILGMDIGQRDKILSTIRLCNNRCCLFYHAECVFCIGCFCPTYIRYMPFFILLKIVQTGLVIFFHFCFSGWRDYILH